ncbi:MAG: DUF4407 domain-containing protein [Chitinophagaceae bacterium]
MTTPTQGQSSLYNYATFEGNNDGPEKKAKFNFLWWCSGAYRKLLEQYPTEHTKYSGLGGVILATFVLASLSAGYAIYSVFGDPYWTVLFALIWGLVIFNFDRFLVGTMRKYGVPFNKQLLSALPRFLLALLIGITIARPLELKIFEKEIDVKVEENRHKKMLLNDSLLNLENSQLTSLATAERSRAASRKAALEDTLRTLQHAYVSEADGTGGSGKRGVETITKLKMDAYNNAFIQFTPEIKRLEGEINYNDSLLKNIQGLTEVKRKNYEAELQTRVGFLERNKALADLSNQETSVFWANLLVSLLVILIEIGPILSKLIVNVGPYDIALARMELMQMAESESAMEQDKQLVFDKLKNVFSQKKEVSSELVNKLTAMQKENIDRDLGQWKKGEWSESVGTQPLDKVVKSIKDKYDYHQDNIL